MARHNKLRGRIADLNGKSFTPSHVSDKLLIFEGCAVKRPKENLDRTKGTTVLDDTLPLDYTE